MITTEQPVSARDLASEIADSARDLASELRARLRCRDEQPLPPLSTRRAIREAAALSARDLADVLGVTGQSIRNWESGRCDPHGAHRAQYREALDVLAGLSPQPAPRRLHRISPASRSVPS